MTAGSEPDDPALPAFALQPIERRLIFQETGRRFGREGVRALLAILALLLVIWTVYLGYRASESSHWTDSKEWLAAVLPAETGILGSALGFYFGSQSDRDRKNRDD